MESSPCMNRPLFHRSDSGQLWEQSVSSVRTSLPPAHLHGFCSNLFATNDVGSRTTHTKDAIMDSHAAFEKAFVEHVGAGTDGMRCGRRMSPSPFVVPRVKLQEMAALQAALSAGLAVALREWGRPGSRLRREMPLSSKAVDTLLRCAEFVEGLPNTRLPVGSFRPDVLIGDDGRLRVCEINARFALNGFLITAATAGALHSVPSDSLLGSLGLGVVPSAQSLVAEVAGRFDPSEDLFVVSGRERLNDLAVLEVVLDNHDCGFAVKYVHPRQLSGHENGSLTCVLDDESMAVNQCILELHQDELLALPDSVMDGLLALSVASRCLNPIWTILLGHDKRMLGVLRTLTARELPDEEARRLLREHIVPTIHLEGANALARFVETHRGLMDATLVAKPCLLGKGEGIIMEKDFESPESFVEAVSDAANRMLEAAEPGAAFPYVFQSFVRQEMFNVLRPPDDDPTLTPAAWCVVATLLCLDDTFLGPGIFRSSQKDVVALCNGGMMLVPALALPCAPPHLRFVAETLRRVEADKVKSALVGDGMALLCLGRAATDPREFEEFVRDDLGGTIHRHSSAVGGVWTIRPTGGGGARSHTAEPFLPHTDASFEPAPPRFFALSVVRADRACGGLLGFASVREAVRRLSEEDFDVLRNTIVRWRRPEEFSKDGRAATTAAPVLFSRRRARVRGDVVETAHLSEREERRFKAAYNRFYAHLAEMCHKSARLFPERAVILMDNQRFVHARTGIRDPRRYLLRIRFDLPQIPEVHRVLEVASAKGLGPQSSRLEDWPVQNKESYMSSINSKFTDRYHSHGGLYWSPSGGSTSASKGAEACAVPSTNEENKAMRMELADLLCSIGAIPRDGSARCIAINLFASGMLYRSLEIFSDVFAAVNATHLPLGSTAPDEDVIRCIEKFGANTLCGWGSHILQLCEAAQSRQATRAMASITTIIHGGEKLSAANRSLITKVCGAQIRIFGCYGSAEAGVFGASLEAKDSEHEQYAIMNDFTHIEIIDDSGRSLGENEWGNIVVTNLKRKSIQPLVRFSMGDIGRLLRSRPGFETVLEVKGRSERALAFRVTPDTDFIFWKEIENVVLGPLVKMAAEAKATCLAQIIVSDPNTVTLAVFTSLPRNLAFVKESTLCSIAFSDFVGRLGVAHIESKTCLLDDMSQLIRSSRSQKLMMWVDQRM